MQEVPPLIELADEGYPDDLDREAVQHELAEDWLPDLAQRGPQVQPLKFGVRLLGENDDGS